MIKILILGGSGILSLDVLKECLKKQYQVTCITRGQKDYRLPQGVRVIHGNVHAMEQLQNQLEKYDVVIDFLSFQVEELKNKLDILCNRCEQYFFVSSAVAYSFQDQVITEETPLKNEYWDYGKNKADCEFFLKEHYSKYNINYTIVRPYITYGKTRIPFGIIPVNGEYWTLANRILHGKPILLWDEGSAKCTITNAKDFSKAFVDLILNPKAYNEAFHITSNEVLTWAEVLHIIGKELKRKPIVCSYPTEEIIQILPEYSGVLLGDKAKNRVFDNSKIVNLSPRLKERIPFSVGIAETIKNYEENPIERTMDYEWDGRIDWAIKYLSKKNGYDLCAVNLSFAPVEDSFSWRDKLSYYCGRYPNVGKIMKFIRIIWRHIKK